MYFNEKNFIITILYFDKVIFKIWLFFYKIIKNIEHYNYFAIISGEVGCSEKN